MNTKLLTAVMKEASKYVAGKDCRMPILKTVRIEVQNDCLRVSATNLEKWFSCTIDSDGTKDMILCVNGKILANLLNELDNSFPTTLTESDKFSRKFHVREKIGEEEKIGTFYTTGETYTYKSEIFEDHLEEAIDDIHNLTLTNNRSTFQLKSEIDVGEFPAMPSSDTCETIKYKAGFIADVYTRVDDPNDNNNYNRKYTGKKYSKYIKIDGLVYKKDRSASWDWEKKKWYCSYLSINNETEIRVFEDEIENYEVVKQ
jgi:DNA polymerase III sliding clamp (beta) subunit (PCNA family)